MNSENQKQDFARQGSWMVISTFFSGVCMLAVHLFAPLLGSKEYGLFGALLAMVNLMAIPGLGLQSVFAQQTSNAISTEEKNQLAGTTQTVLKWTFFLWFAWALVVFIFRNNFFNGLKIAQPLALWITILIGLAQLWGPILLGVLQGQQNFLWMGWAAIVTGLGRFVAVGICVFLLGGTANSAILGAFVGIAAATSIAGIKSRAVWQQPKIAFVFDWKSWLGKVVPLTLGLGAGQFILSADMIFVRTVFGEDQTGFYSASGMMGRGLVAFAAPLAMVMFPKIVHNLRHGKKTNVLGYTLMATAAMCCLAAISCTALAIFLKYLVRNPDLARTYLSPSLFEKLYKPEAMSVLAQLIPWFVWCMLPLALANVLLNNLMARKEFRVVPYLLIVIAAYTATLTLAGDTFVRVIQILGIYNLVFLGVLGGFTHWSAKLAVNAEALALQEKL